MLFNSYTFVALVLVTFVIYYLPPLRRYQVGILIVASLVFYAYSEPWLLSLLVASIFINASCSFLVYTTPTLKGRRLWASAGVAVNLLVLLFFKYGALTANTLRFTPAESGLAHALINLPLPVGISFYTFQGISLVIDVFRQREGDPNAVAPESFNRHLSETAFFIAFFPQLVAGPIMKARDFYPQIASKPFQTINWEAAFRALVAGYFLKVVIADNLRDLTVWIDYPCFNGYSTLLLLTSLLGFSMQIFADFAGYSLIAIGTARLFGYELMVNFDFPYIAQSLSEFWRRWHISLSTWLREYLYIPLGGNRRGPARTYFNLIAVMTLGGLWHGASWNFALWGFVHGCGLAIERMFSSRITANEPKPFSVLRAIAVFSFVTSAWLFFKFPELKQVLMFLRCLRDNTYLPTDLQQTAYILLYCAPVIAYHAWYLAERRWGITRAQWCRPALYGACLFGLVVNSGSPTKFIYFQF